MHRNIQYKRIDSFYSVTMFTYTVLQIFMIFIYYTYISYIVLL